MSKYLTPDKVSSLLFVDNNEDSSISDRYLDDDDCSDCVLSDNDNEEDIILSDQSMIPRTIMMMMIMQQLEMQMTKTLQTRLLRSSNQKVV